LVATNNNILPVDTANGVLLLAKATAGADNDPCQIPLKNHLKGNYRLKMLSFYNYTRSSKHQPYLVPGGNQIPLGPPQASPDWVSWSPDCSFDPQDFDYLEVTVTGSQSSDVYYCAMLLVKEAE